MHRNGLGGPINAMESSDKTTVLEVFESPGHHIAIFETDELTALCPFDFGGPDFYSLKLVYEPDDLVVESRSLKNYIESFRSKELSAEAIAVKIHSDVTGTIDPKTAYVCLEQSRRGGIEETVEVGNDPR